MKTFFLESESLITTNRKKINIRSHWGRVPRVQQKSSAKLTNQRVSYAFISNPLSFHARHMLPTSQFQHSYSCILHFTYFSTDIGDSEQHV